MLKFGASCLVCKVRNFLAGRWMLKLWGVEGPDQPWSQPSQYEVWKLVARSWRVKRRVTSSPINLFPHPNPHTSTHTSLPLTAQTRYYHHPQIWPYWYILKDSIQPIRLLQLNYRTIFNWQICSSMQPALKRDCSPQVPTTSQSPQQNCLFWSPDHICSDWHWIVK